MVYRISCDGCEASYVGQTRRLLRNRIKEHKKINIANPSVVHEHMIESDHSFKWDDVEILDRESYYYKRLISEMFFIQSQCSGLNLQTDTELLGESYKPIISLLGTPNYTR